MAGSSSCLNSSVAERVDDPRVTLYSHVLGPGYLTELGVNTAGAAIDWAVRRLGFGRHAALSADAERFDRRLSRARARSGHPSEAAPLFVPYLGDGERNDPAIRGALVGLSHRHDRPAIAYAVLEGVAFALRAALGALEAAGCRFDELRVSGGAARAAVGSRVKADVLGRPVTMLTEDTTAIGCALLAAVGTGHEREAREAVAAVLRRSRRYEPRRARDALQAARAAWFADVRESPALRVPDGPGAVS
jgi:sugar (pentulose or hexulose) kinase